MDFLHQLRELGAQLRDRRLDRVAAVVGHGHGRGALLAREQRCDQAVAVGTLLLHRLDVEPESGQRFREHLEVVVRDRRVRAGVGVDLQLARRQQAIGFVQAEHRQRAADLLAVLGERREVGALAVVAEERVEHLLHVPQVGLDLAADLREQHALLRAFRHFVEHRRGGRGAALAGARGVEAREHRVDLLREIAAQAAVVLERALRQQQGSRVFHRHRLRHAGRGHLVEALHQRRRQLHHRAVADLGRLRVHRRQRLLELRQVLRAARRELEPGVLGARQLLARLAQQRLDLDQVGVEHFRRRNQAGQPECSLHRLHLRRHRRADRHVVQNFATEAVGDLGAAFDDTPDLQVDPRGELLDAETGLEAVLGQRLEQRPDRPPERPQPLRRRRVLDTGDRVAHRARAVLVAAQPGKQAALERTALLDEVGRQLGRGNRLAWRNLRRPWRKIGIEQVGRRRGLDPARRLHRLVLWEQLERNRRRAVDQLVQENAQLAAGAIDVVAGRHCRRRRHFLDQRELALDLVGERDHGVETDHLDRAGGLVYVLARMLERRRVLGRRLEDGERVQAARQRLVDLSLHPRKRAKIEFGCGVGRHGRAPDHSGYRHAFSKNRARWFPGAARP